MELHPQLHKAVKHSGIISYSKDDLLGKQCVIPCKWCCHWSVNSRWGLSCLGINQMLQPPQNTNCCAKITVKSRRAKCWMLCLTWIGLEYLWDASHGWAKSSLTLFFLQCNSMCSSSQLWVVFGPLDSSGIILFVVNSGKGKARGYFAGVRKDELCLSLSQLQPHCCDCCSSTANTFVHILTHLSIWKPASSRDDLLW